MENNKNMKKQEKINRKREKVNRRENRKKKKKKKEDEKLLLRPWDTLPSLALSKIIRNLSFKNRFGSIPFVCKAWNYVISDDLHCWSSMIPESISPDDAFIKKPDCSITYIPSVVIFNDYRRLRKEVARDPGVSHLRNLIKKSSPGGVGGGSLMGSGSSTITSLCLDPFHFSNSDDTNDSIHQDEILHLIAHCCPNLKHISFDGFYCASIEAVLEVFHRCKKIELIDFSDSGYADSVQVIEVLGKCLPNLRGIRMAGWKKYCIHDVIATHLPRIKLLAVDYRSSYDEDFQKLTSETECCLTELQYLSVGLYDGSMGEELYRIIDPPPVCTHIPEFHYEEHGYDWDFDCKYCQPLRPVPPVHRPQLRYRPVCFPCFEYIIKEAREKEEAEEKEEKEALEYYRFDEVNYYSIIMKTKKECEYYVSISKEKKKNTRRNHPYVVLRTRMRKNKKEASFISKMKMRKKRDKYDYQDYYVQPLL